VQSFWTPAFLPARCQWLQLQRCNAAEVHQLSLDPSALMLAQVPSELLVNIDHPATAATWIELAYNTSGWVVPVFSADVHEIRAYNRLGHMARGQVLVLLQVSRAGNLLAYKR
jgi:hypothetical protein